MNKIFALLCSVSLAGVFAGTSVTKVYLERQAQNLPDISPVIDYKNLGNTEILDKNGKPIQVFSSEYHENVPYDKIPPFVIQAFISAEDRNYWKHHGIDYSATLRAGINDLMGKHILGASTITQQVVKNLITGNKRTYDRKITEALLAIKVENSISKERIIEIYLNSIWFGYGAYGIGPASKAYFNKDISELTLGEAAFLASLPKGPSIIDPINHPQRALSRRLYVLERMKEDHTINQQQYDMAKNEPLPTPRKINMSGQGNSWFTEIIRRQIAKNYNSDMIYSNNAKVISNQDIRIQSITDRALKNGLETYDKRHGWHGNSDIVAHPEWRKGDIISCESKQHCIAKIENEERNISSSWNYRFHEGDTIFINDNDEITQEPEVNGSVIIMDARDGSILAESGGYEKGDSSFDRAIQSKRQPGSLIKPFVALEALSLGWHNDSSVLDMPISLDTGNGLWSPSADGGDGIGLITMGKALALSRNMAFVRIANEVGFDKIYDILSTFHIYDNTSKDMSIVLGSHEVSLIDIVSAYARLANGGYDVLPSFYKNIEVNGKTLWTQPETGHFNQIKVNDRNASELMPELNDMLKGVIEHGTAYSPFKGMTDIMGKTGTSNNVYDSWFVGYSGYYVVGVHVGYDTPRSLGEHEFGSTVAAPIAATIFKELSL